MAVKSNINIYINNLPIGSVVNVWGANSLADIDSNQSFIDNQADFIKNLNQYYYKKNAYSGLMSTEDVSTLTRNSFLLNSSDYTLFFDASSKLIQTSADGSTFTNYDINYLASDSPNNYLRYFANNANNKVVFTNTLYTYVYSTDGLTFNNVQSPIVSSAHIKLSSPVISGSTYSFFDLTNSKRIYTTDHTTFSDVTGFGTTELQIHQMNNGYLYTHTGTTLRVSTNNGVTWTSYTLPASTNNSGNHCLDFDGTTYVYGTTSNALYSSTDLTTWNSRTSGISATPILVRVWFVNSLWFVFSGTASTTSFSTSADGVTWNNRTWGSGQSLRGNAVIYVNSLYMVLATARVQTSPTGVTWTDSLSAGQNDANALNMTFNGTGTKALMLSSGVCYFYNAGVWTTITTSQFITNVVRLNTTNVTNQFIKAK